MKDISIKKTVRDIAPPFPKDKRWPKHVVSEYSYTFKTDSQILHCGDCPSFKPYTPSVCFSSEDGHCGIDGKARTRTELRPSDCPLTETEGKKEIQW